MKVVSLIVCSLLALPALAQGSKPTPKPEKELKREQRAAEEAFSIFMANAAFHQGLPVKPTALPEDRHVAKVPEADQALLDIQKAAQEARNAKDLDATLKALDEIERAVMRARAALRKADTKTEGETKK